MNAQSLLKRISLVLISSSLFLSCEDSHDAVPAASPGIQSINVEEEPDSRKKPLVLLGGTEGVFKASTLGESFEASNKGLSGNALIVQAFLEDKSVIYAGTKNGVYATKNDGKSWSPSNIGMSGEGLNVVSLFKKDDVFYAGSFGGGIYTSSDGKAWTTLNSGLIGGGLVVRAIIEHDGDIYIGTHYGVYKLNDAGTGWLQVNGGLNTYDFTVVGLVSTETSIYAATFGGLLKELKDGDSSWITLSNGLTDGFVNAVAVVGNKLYVGGNTYGVFVYDGNAFVPFNTGLPSPYLRVRAFAVKGNTVLMSAINGGTYYTTDGLTWVANSGEIDDADYWGVHMR
jgi:hypothetical protein